ncbi:DUF3047 domain-containing protein [Hydrogenophaga pseudoflava]|uniref:DUF3047 domain-containing protein n=1 Tax=Hydrogenophaga pseudoflava TaxID=47421 RepID=UPI0027E51B38|nr:DUF3047 domain-containing protein [Hydrogenophaga pseudoflava]MDQ7745861.1 DUF3047 domain-containing protein [Hydrogenophaga pseudoflava]
MTRSTTAPGTTAPPHHHNHCCGTHAGDSGSPPMPSASRRQWVKGLAAAPLLAGPCAMAHADSPKPAPGAIRPAAELAQDFRHLARGVEAVARIESFTLAPSTLPWSPSLGELKAGQQVTFFLNGLWWFSKEHGRWLEPGFVFFARVAGSGGASAIHNTMQNTGTLTADRAGRLQIARSAGEFANPQGDLAVPLAQYLAGEGRVEGVAVVWNGPAEDGLLALSARGDVQGLVRAELQRQRQARLMPAGWHNFFAFGDGGIFTEGPGQRIDCETHKNVGILQYPLADQPLRPGLTLDWQWVVDRLPSHLPENQILTHDYLSIAVEFDDGQDITYLWSSSLPVGQVFRCPLPGWDAVETHVVQRSGLADLGKAFDERRDLFEDYRRIVGGKATRAVRVWLIANSLFLRQVGRCAYRRIAIGQTGQLQRIL